MGGGTTLLSSSNHRWFVIYLKNPYTSRLSSAAPCERALRSKVSRVGIVASLIMAQSRERRWRGDFSPRTSTRTACGYVLYWVAFAATTKHLTTSWDARMTDRCLMLFFVTFISRDEHQSNCLCKHNQEPPPPPPPWLALFRGRM